MPLMPPEDAEREQLKDIVQAIVGLVGVTCLAGIIGLYAWTFWRESILCPNAWMTGLTLVIVPTGALSGLIAFHDATDKETWTRGSSARGIVLVRLGLASLNLLLSLALIGWFFGSVMTVY